MTPAEALRQELADMTLQLPRPEHASSVGIVMIRMHKALTAVEDLLGEAPLGGDFQTGYMQAMRDVREAMTTALTEAKDPTP